VGGEELSGYRPEGVDFVMPGCSEGGLAGAALVSTEERANLICLTMMLGTRLLASDEEVGKRPGQSSLQRKTWRVERRYPPSDEGWLIELPQ
jgi:hypothetical protein